MQAIVLGDGAMGRAIADALANRGEPRPPVLGRPRPPRAIHDLHDLGLGSDTVLVEASRGEAVQENLVAGLGAGVSRFVIATTGWETSRDAVERDLLAARATAVVASNFSPGVVLFGRLVEEATRLFGALDAFDPYLVEWHRRTKVDRPSGTARALAERIIANHPTKTRIAQRTAGTAEGPPATDELDVAVIRAGAAPGMHLVGFDAPGESLELRLTARDRSAYASGVLAAIDWLRVARYEPGFVPFDPVVVDSMLAGTPGAPPLGALPSLPPHPPLAPPSLPPAPPSLPPAPPGLSSAPPFQPVA